MKISDSKGYAPGFDVLPLISVVIIRYLILFPLS